MKHKYAIYAACAIMALVAFSEAKAGGFEVLELRNGVATSSGIAPEPSPSPWYRGGGRIMSRPSARIAHSVDAIGMAAPAPANGCESLTGGFRSMSGGDRGYCYARNVPLQ